MGKVKKEELAVIRELEKLTGKDEVIFDPGELAQSDL